MPPLVLIESIIGTDDRVQISATTSIPWRRICALKMKFPNGSYRGTGFFIGPRTVATAGHCVYLKSAGGWAESIEVIPGCNGTTRPFGTATSTNFRSVSGWVTGSVPSSDYGCIVLPNGAFGGKNLGSFGFAAWSAPEILALPAVVAGYPGDKPFAELWGMARRIKAVTPVQVRYDVDTMGGQSGAPVYVKRNGQRYVVGIHNYGGSTVNSATRIAPSAYISGSLLGVASETACAPGFDSGAPIRARHGAGAELGESTGGDHGRKRDGLGGARRESDAGAGLCVEVHLRCKFDKTFRQLSICANRRGWPLRA